MRNSPRRIARGTLFLLGALAAPAAGAQPTLDSLIARHVAALGGHDRLRTVRTARLVGRVVTDAGSGTDTVELARPARIRSTLTIGGRTVVEGYDGRLAWAADGLIAHPVPPDQARSIAAGADLEGPLVDYAAKGNSVELVGRDTADGRPAWKLRVGMAGGAMDTYYLDAETFLRTKWQGRRTVNGRPVVLESFFRDWRPVDGMMWAHRIDSSALGREDGEHLIFERILLNVPVSDARFAMPSAAPRP